MSVSIICWAQKLFHDGKDYPTRAAGMVKIITQVVIGTIATKVRPFERLRATTNIMTQIATETPASAVGHTRSLRTGVTMKWSSYLVMYISNFCCPMWRREVKDERS